MRLEERLMTALANFVTRFHKIIPFVAIVLFALSIISANNIKVKTQMKDLLPEDNPQVQSYEEINDYFSGGTSVLITIEGKHYEVLDSPIRSHRNSTLAMKTNPNGIQNKKVGMAACAEMFAKEIEKSEAVMKYVRAINLKIDKDFVTNWGFMFQKASDLEKSRKMFSKLNMLPFVTALNDSFEETYTGDEAEEDISTSKQENDAVAMLNQMETFFSLLRNYLENPSSELLEIQGQKLAETFIYGDSYGYSPDNTMLMFSISPNFSATDIEECVDLMAGIKKVKSKVEKQFPHLHIGYTGDVAIQADEQEAMGFDMLVPAVVALIIILVLFVFSFNQIRAIVFTLVTLVMGIVFNYGLVGITIKEINMLTSFMGALLIGLGIDYGIQIVTNFTMFREDGYEPKEALKHTYIKAGMGNLLAAFTTAVAFFVMAATGSKAFSQFGLVAGMGIIMCLFAMIFILPAILLWFGKKDVSRSRMPNINYSFLPALGKFTSRHKWATIVIGILITAGLFLAAFTNKFEYDFMKLEPQHMTSIIQYDKVMEKFDITPSSAMVITDSIEESRKLTEYLEKENLVAEVNSISNYIPTAEEQAARLAEIAKIKKMPKRYNSYQYTANDMEQFANEIQRLEWNIIEIGDLSVAGLGEDNKIVKKRNRMIREIFGAEVGKPGEEIFQKLIQLIQTNPLLYADRLSNIDETFAEEMDGIVSAMAQIDRKITINDLPESMTSQFLDESKARNLITIYPKKGIMDDMKKMRRLNRELEEISPKITGTTQIIISWLDEVFSASRKAALLIFIVVFICMALSFRSLRYSVLAIAPLFLGLIWMLGFYPLLGLKINALNIAVIPLIIGMGIDFGIHIVHRFMVENDIDRVYRYTGKAVFLSALTTMIGFGSLALIGSFASIALIGAILFLGIVACLLTTLIILPAFLVLGRKR